MKSLLIALTVVCGSFAMANEAAKTETAPAAAVAPAAPAAATEAPATAEATAPAKKLNKKQAKEECLKENAALKGKELNACVKTKTM